MEPRFTLVRSPHYTVIIAQSQTAFHSSNNMRLAPCDTITSPLGSLLPSIVGDYIRDVPLYQTVIFATKMSTLTAHGLVRPECCREMALPSRPMYIKRTLIDLLLNAPTKQSNTICARVLHVDFIASITGK